MEYGFPQRLKRMRDKAGLKQKVLSERCGLYPEAINKYEKGVKPDVEAIFAIAEFFGCTVEFLWLGEEK